MLELAGGLRLEYIRVPPATPYITEIKRFDSTLFLLSLCPNEVMVSDMFLTLCYKRIIFCKLQKAAAARNVKFVVRISCR